MSISCWFGMEWPMYHMRMVWNMHMVHNMAMPIYFIDGKRHIKYVIKSREKPWNLFNQSYMAYITPYHATGYWCPRGRTHRPTHAQTYTDTHTNARTEAILRNQVRVAEGCTRLVSGLKSAWLYNTKYINMF